ncbi:MAG: GDSL-type esterase/lipase family protein [Ruminococcus sp.]
MKNPFRKIVAAALSAAMTMSAAGSLNLHAEVTANPVISRNVPAYSVSNPATAGAANDEHYFSFWFGTAPEYLAYDLSSVPEEQRKRIMLVWYNTSSYDQIGNYISKNAEPSDYTIEVNSAEGGAFPEDGWVVVDTVTDNTLSSRQHLIDFEGCNWVRMNISKADGKEGGSVSVNMDIHNVSDGVNDSWIFFGDSITAGGMNNCYGTGFATYVNQLDSRYFPIQENGGIGGITSTDGRNNIDRWLSVYPGKYVSIAYGTNDAWGNQTGAEKYYENTKYMIDAATAAGKTVVLPKIPYSTETGINTYLDEYNAMIDRLWEEYPQIVQGPDFDAYFRENPDMLGGDGVHPSSDGYDAMRKIWAETMYERVYTQSVPETSETTSESGEKVLYGDANLDGEINVNDVVSVMCYSAAPETISFSEAELEAADVYLHGDGVNGSDAVTIQKYLAKIVLTLPESYKGNAEQ